MEHVSRTALQRSRHACILNTTVCAWGSVPPSCHGTCSSPSFVSNHIRHPQAHPQAHLHPHLLVLVSLSRQLAANFTHVKAARVCVWQHRAGDSGRAWIGAAGVEGTCQRPSYSMSLFPAAGVRRGEGGSEEEPRNLFGSFPRSLHCTVYMDVTSRARGGE
jgi:hypothetical protein